MLRRENTQVLLVSDKFRTLVATSRKMIRYVWYANVERCMEYNWDVSHECNDIKP